MTGVVAEISGAEFIFATDNNPVRHVADDLRSSDMTLGEGCRLSNPPDTFIAYSTVLAGLVLVFR